MVRIISGIESIYNDGCSNQYLSLENLQLSIFPIFYFIENLYAFNIAFNSRGRLWNYQLSLLPSLSCCFKYRTYRTFFPSLKQWILVFSSFSLFTVCFRWHSVFEIISGIERIYNDGCRNQYLSLENLQLSIFPTFHFLHSIFYFTENFNIAFKVIRIYPVEFRRCLVQCNFVTKLYSTRN